MNPQFDAWPASLIEKFVELDTCDGYVVLVHDPQTREADAHGPYDGLRATDAADRMRRELDSAGLADVQVTVTRLHRSSLAA